MLVGRTHNIEPIDHPLPCRQMTIFADAQVPAEVWYAGRSPPRKRVSRGGLKRGLCPVLPHCPRDRLFPRI